MENARLINEMMSSSSRGIILYANMSNQLVVFFNKLSNCYANTFWYNGATNAPSEFALEFAKVVLKDKQDRYQDILKLKYCEYNWDVDSMIIDIVLEEIAQLNGDVLFIFDYLELYPKNFNYGIFEYLINKCPKNLRIVIASSDITILNYSAFEPLCPKLIEYPQLEENLDFDFSHFTKEEVEFLFANSTLRYVSKGFLDSTSDFGYELFLQISQSNSDIIAKKGVDEFYINSKLTDILLEKFNYLKDRRELKDNAVNGMYKYCMVQKKYINAMWIARKLNTISVLDRLLKEIMSDENGILKLLQAIQNDTTIKLTEEDKSEYLYAYFYSVILGAFNGNPINAIKKIDDILLLDKPKSNLSLYCNYAKIVIYAQKVRIKDIAKVIETVFEEEGDITERIFPILVYLPSIISLNTKYTSLLFIEQLEEKLKTNRNSVYEIKGNLAVAYCYLQLGSYKRAIKIMKELRERFSHFVVPNELMQYFYYAGEMELAEKLALEALYSSNSYNNTYNLSNIYVLLSKIYMYYNRQDDALIAINKAVKHKNNSEVVKYYAIAVKSFLYAKSGKLEYAKNLAKIYIKYTELEGSSYYYFFCCAYSYACFLQNNNDEAFLYANNTLSNSNSKSGIWMIASGILISELIKKKKQNEAISIVEKFLSTAENNKLDIVIVDFKNCFSSIINFAIENNICIQYIDKLSKLKLEKEMQTTQNNCISIKTMGSTKVSVNGEEIQWKTKKAKELFLYYAICGENGINRNTIYDTMWKDYVYESFINNLKTTNNLIRKTLEKYKIKFSLVYSNSKYVLKLENKLVDYERYMQLVDMYNNTTKNKLKREYMEEICSIYSGGFATEFHNMEFKQYDKKISQEITLLLIQTVKMLINEKDYLSAKKFCNKLMLIDNNESNHILLDEIDKNLRIK